MFLSSLMVFLLIKSTAGSCCYKDLYANEACYNETALDNIAETMYPGRFKSVSDIEKRFNITGLTLVCPDGISPKTKGRELCRWMINNGVSKRSTQCSFESYSDNNRCAETCLNIVQYPYAALPNRWPLTYVVHSTSGFQVWIEASCGDPGSCQGTLDVFYVQSPILVSTVQIMNPADFLNAATWWEWHRHPSHCRCVNNKG